MFRFCSIRCRDRFFCEPYPPQNQDNITERDTNVRMISSQIPQIQNPQAPAIEYGTGGENQVAIWEEPPPPYTENGEIIHGEEYDHEMLQITAQERVGEDFFCSPHISQPPPPGRFIQRSLEDPVPFCGNCSRNPRYVGKYSVHTNPSRG